MTNCLRTVDKPASCMRESGMGTPGMEPTTRNDDALRAAVERTTGRPASLDIVQKPSECPQWNRDEDGDCLDHPAIPCCTYVDHGDDMGCACPEHPYSSQHPFGETDDDR